MLTPHSKYATNQKARRPFVPTRTIACTCTTTLVSGWQVKPNTFTLYKPYTSTRTWSTILAILLFRVQTCLLREMRYQVFNLHH